MFRSSSLHTLDEKGRFILPARFRDVIRACGSEKIIMSHLDGGIIVYTLEGWSRIENNFLSLPQTSSHLRRFRRVVIGSATECSWDKQGRILIPPFLRQIAQLEKEIALIGVLDHFEIWARERWEEEEGQLEKDMQQEDVRAEIAKLGL